MAKLDPVSFSQKHYSLWYNYHFSAFDLIHLKLIHCCRCYTKMEVQQCMKELTLLFTRSSRGNNKNVPVPQIHVDLQIRK